MNNIPDLSSSFDCAPCGLVTTEVNGTICRVNTTFCNWLGFTPSELINNKRIQDLFTIGGRFFHHTHWAPLLQLQGSVSEVQMDLVTSDGKTLPMLINVSRQKHGDSQFDQLAFFVATERKNYERELISARKSVEESLASLHTSQEELQESRDILSIAIRSARMGVWTQDIKSGEVWWTPELQQLTGWTDKEIWATPEQFYNLIHPDDLSSFATALQNSIDTKSDFDIQFRLKHSDASWLAMEGRGHATYSETGEALTIVGVIMDVSERKATERELHQLNQQLSIADRRKDEFLATLGHELRNPLAPIRNVLEIMRLKETEDSFMHWSREMIERHISQMTHLVDDLMEASRISQGRLELRMRNIDIADPMQSAIESTQSIMDKSKHTLTVTRPESPIFVEADTTRLTQIIANLLNNAGKYTPDGGDISLSAFQQGNEVVLSVKDSGMGIPPEQLTNVFNMFSQLTPALEHAQGGLGIGLALVHGLVKLHDGSIVAHSEGDGKGSEFIVRLPISRAPIEITPIVEKPIDLVTDSKRILVIEDNIDAAESLSMLLEFSGHSTRIANSGMDGIIAAEEFCPDVILLDIGLPDINGYQVAQHIRQQTWGKDIFLIAATGWGQDKDKALAKEAGFDKHLIKPINFQDLKSLLQKINR
tara:strand:+ start:20004 stop:21959 length:1956 start_codon:yes stop_codon:yes gene_type:complete